MTTFLQTTSGDFDISNAKQLSIVTDPDAQAAQKLRNLFLSFLGNWAFDVRIGVPYFQAILGQKNPNLGIISQLFREVILSVPWVNQVTALTVTLNANRQLNLIFACTTQSGATIQGGTGVPFLVTIPSGSAGSLS